MSSGQKPGAAGGVSRRVTASTNAFSDVLLQVSSGYCVCSSTLSSPLLVAVQRRESGAQLRSGGWTLGSCSST